MRNLIIVDDFFEDPDFYREYALNLTYRAPARDEDWRGFRSYDYTENHLKLIPYFIKRLRMINPWWEDFRYNYCFHYTLESTKETCFPSFLDHKIHKDTFLSPDGWAGLVYLNPTPDPSCGTTFYNEEKLEVESVENKYNRFIFYPSNMWHAPTNLFGTDVNDARLVLTLFGDPRPIQLGFASIHLRDVPIG